jgi:hypothetical protein
VFQVYLTKLLTKMSGPLEVVAGAFAVVGFADVVVRAGAQCSRFLSSMADAPAEIKRLQDCISENRALVI